MNLIANFLKVQIVNNSFKRCSIFLAIREVKIKTTLT